MAVSFTVSTYNVLADAYIKREWYPLTPNDVFEPTQRLNSLLACIVELDADILCLQEVERETFAAIDAHLSPQGYAGFFCQKAKPKPDGCATFYRDTVFSPGDTVRLQYADARAGQRPTGHVAHLVSLQQEGHRLGLANTHLKWDPPGTPRENQYAYQQVAQLLRERQQLISGCGAWIICGDLNATPSGDAIALLQDSGLKFTHSEYAAAYTANINGNAKTIDYLFHDPGLRSEPLPLPPVSGHTVLPGPDQPSDHVPGAARFVWV